MASLNRFLQSSEIMGQARRGGPALLRGTILERGGTWYGEHPDEAARIAANLSQFGLPCSDRHVQDVQRHVLLHYYEKILPLSCSPVEYREYLSRRVEARGGLGRIADAQAGGKAALLAVAHFGAVELIVPTLALHRQPVTGAVRFATEELSRRAAERAAMLTESGGFGPIGLIEIGKPRATAALDMAAVIRRGEILVSVFDERTDYSTPCSLFGRTVWGGAGLDRLIAFSGAPLAAFTAFMVRSEEETYALNVQDLPLDREATVQAMYDHLARNVKEHAEQWYFLHEEIPVVDGDLQ
jgi:lauroyl/myristoyl acyltransferase